MNRRWVADASPIDVGVEAVVSVTIRGRSLEVLLRALLLQYRPLASKRNYL